MMWTGFIPPRRVTRGGLVVLSKRIFLASLFALALGLSVTAPALATKEHILGATFGTAGSGNGEFNEPEGVAVNDATGNAYVVDRGNNRVEQFTATGEYLSQFDGAAAPTGAFSNPQAVAVDNSTNPLDPSAGDVYVTDTGHKVIDKFTAEGTYLGQIAKGSGAIPYHGLFGVAVDPEGAVWVFQSTGEIDNYTNSLANVFVSHRQDPFEGSPGFAVDAVDNLYANREAEVFSKLNSVGERLIDALDPQTSTAAAVDPATGEVYVDNLVTVAVFDSASSCTAASLCESPPESSLIERFGSQSLSGSHGIAVNANGTAYASQRGANDVEIFNYIQRPVVNTEAASAVAETGAMLHGTVRPEGEAVTACGFEYGPEAGFYPHTLPCSPATPFAGSEPAIPVSANVSGLEPRTTYHFRLSAANPNPNSTRNGNDESFYTVAKPEIANESVSDIGATTATVTAAINPSGLPTGYHVEYGPSAAYGAATPEVATTAAQTFQNAQVPLSELQPNTEYHYRIVAKNSLGAAAGADGTFTTIVPSSTPPDDRVAEMVTPVENNGADVYSPNLEIQNFGEFGVESYLPFRASPSGDAVTYAGEPTPEGTGAAGGHTLGNQFLARRTASGWTQQNISPRARPRAFYEAFSADLTTGVLRAGGNQIEPSALLEEAPSGYGVLYERSSATGATRALFTSFVGAPPEAESFSATFAGGSEDFKTLLFEASAALTPGAPAGNDLYEETAGQLSLVNVLPNGATEPEASFGAPATSLETTPEYSHDISQNGTRIFWTGQQSKGLYMHEVGAPTLQLDASQAAGLGGGGQFRTASGDGSKIFFTDDAAAGLTGDTIPGSGANLYEYDLTSHLLHDLSSSPHADVLGVVGASSDGSYVYFGANGALAPGALEGANLYERHDGVTRYIATLSEEDGTSIPPYNGTGSSLAGDWAQGMGARTAEVTGDGGHLTFVSRRPLTAYDNHNLTEVYVYSAATAQLLCASCDPTGAPPTPWPLHPALGGILPNSGTEDGLENFNRTLGNPNTTRTPTWISADGSKVFFDSAVPLAPEDTNGRVDVYEWERDGSGTCSRTAGCVYLLSGGKSSENSYLYDTSETGSDVFFDTRAQLAEADRNETTDVYDAREGGLRPATPPACSGAGCQGVPPAPPQFAIPPSTNFNGLGNFPPLGQANTSTKTAAQIKAERLAKALSACKRYRAKAKRRHCQASARKRFGPAKHSRRASNKGRGK